MSFTLAHPAAVLPFWRCRFLFFPALIIGSLSPDFVYFLQGMAISGIGHTFYGMLLIDLPLSFLIFFVYCYLWRDVFRNFLPNCLNADYPFVWRFSARFLLIFAISAFIGMITHVFWDSFTHHSGFFVEKIPLLKQRVFGLQIYKWLQHGGGVIGMAFWFLFVLLMAKRFPLISKIKSSNKWRFWIVFLVAVMAVWGLWLIISPMSRFFLATLVIRFVDCFLIVLSIVGIYLKIIQNKISI